jgi:hypothetical protein
MPESLPRRESLEGQRRLLEAELYRLYGPEHSGMRWVTETLARLETQQGNIGYSEQDRTDLRKAGAVLDRMQVIARLYNPDQPRGPDGRWGGGGALPNAVKYLDSHTKPLNELTPEERNKRNCAHVVTIALAQDGIDIKPSERPKPPYAKDYGAALERHGFDREASVNQGVGYPPPKTMNYTPEPGDVVVIQSIPRHPEGHIAMYTGTQWASYFKQGNFWPHRDYGKFNPSYIIYRYKKNR